MFSSRSNLPSLFTPTAVKILARPRAMALLAALVALPFTSGAESEKEARYPYDPACPWGRLANGKGMIHRCISEEEAKRVASGELQPSPSSSSAKPGPSGTPGSGPAPNTAPAGDTAVESPGEKAPKEFTVSVGPIHADKGDITIGKLGVPVDRYRACVVENGGLELARGKVVISFLVQAARSRAEGVEVSRVSGISKKAAQCIADVVDRRRVGTPTEETTGAQLTIELIGK